MTHRLATTVGAIAAALTLSGSVALAAAPAGQPARFLAAGTSTHAGNCSDVYGRAWADAALAAMTSQAVASQADEQEPDETDDESGDHERPQNHGWFVSQAAHDTSTTGRDHGNAGSEVARGDDGNPESAKH